MGDPRLIPLSDAAKTRVDVVAVPSTLLGWFQAIPWTEFAAAAACLYTLLRIIEVLWGWARQWRR